jgi:hypothetical protein
VCRKPSLSWSFPAALVLAGLMVPLAVAQHAPSPTGGPNEVTISVKFTEERQGGKLTGCGLMFSQIVRDYADRDGGAVLIEGAVAIVQVKPQRWATWLKVCPSDLRHGKDGKFQPGPAFKPAYAYATIGGQSTVGKEHVADACPEEVGYCNGYTDVPLVGAMVQLPTTRRLTVAYQRHRPGIDVTTSIDLRPDDHSAEAPLDAYTDCNSSLLR